MRWGLAFVLGAMAVAPGCNTSPPPSRSAGGLRDTGFCCSRDAMVPPRLDAGGDAFAWPDTGPPVVPVLPAQSWTMTVRASGDVLDLTIDLDARAESGLARAVAGGGGRSATLIFDVLRDGVLRPRNPIVIGLPGIHTCSYDTLSLDDLRLQFSDLDGDGVREALTSVSSVGDVTRTGGALPPSVGEMVTVGGIARDETEPTISLLDPSFLPGVEPLVLVANEPIGPAFMPMLTGTRSVLLTADVGASAAARWSVETSTLPPGHYELTLAPPEDLSGQTATAPLPTAAFDVVAPVPLGIDGVDSRFDDLVSSAPPVIIGDDLGETPIEGGTSVLVGARSAMSFYVATAGSHAIDLWLRVAGPAGYAPTGVSVYDDHDVAIGQTVVMSKLVAPGLTEGFPADGSSQNAGVMFVAARAGRFHVLIEAYGPRDVACGGVTVPPLGPYGAVVDSIQLY